MPDSTQIRSNCRACTAGCGLIAEVVDGRLVRVRGDVDHPVSHGYLCPKGQAIPWSHYSSARLGYPTIQGRRVDWPTYLDDLAARLQTVIDDHGPGVLGWYEGNGTASDPVSRVSMSKLFWGLGSTQQYSALTIDIAPMFRVAQLVTGSPILLPDWRPEDPAAQLVLMLGINPMVLHNYVSQFSDPVRRTREFQGRGGQIWIADPRVTKATRLADHHLQIRPSTDFVLLGWLVRELLDTGSTSDEFRADTTAESRARLGRALGGYTLSRTATVTGLDEDELQTLRDQIVRVGPIGVVTGTGINFQRQALLTEWLRWVLLLMTGSFDRRGGMVFNPGFIMPFDQLAEPLPESGRREALPPPASRPDVERVMGEIPVVAMADEIEAGNLRALMVTGGNPVSSFPDPAATRAFLSRLSVLAVNDVVSTATTEIASHVAPSTSQMEKPDLILRVRAMVAPAVLPPAQERKPLWWIAAQLGRRLGVDILAGRDPDEVTDEDMLGEFVALGRTDMGDALEAGSHGLELPDIVGYVRDGVLAGGRWNILAEEFLSRLEALGDPIASGHELTLINGRQLSRFCSHPFVPPEKTKDRPTVSVSPADALRLGIADGERVRVAVAGGNGELELDALVDANLPDGAVWIPEGWSDVNVSHLVDGQHDIDPFAAQPTMTGIPVLVTKTALQCPAAAIPMNGTT